MRAIVNTRAGPVIGEAPEPAPRDNEALVAVHAFSLNRGELRLFQVRPEGWRPGQDIAGVVVRQAADGSGPATGTRVVALCDWEGWAERAAVPSHRMAPLADTVSFAAAAALPVAGLTALRTLRHGAPLLGARVTAVAGSAERARVLDGLGAAEIVTDIAAATGRFGLILEAAGGASLKAAIGLIEAKGTIVVYGNSSGEDTPLNFRDFAEHQNARIQGFHYFTSEPEERFAPDLALLAGLVADGSLRPLIVEHDWSELAAAGERLRARRIAGKAVFHIPQT